MPSNFSKSSISCYYQEHIILLIAHPLVTVCLLPLVGLMLVHNAAIHFHSHLMKNGIIFYFRRMYWIWSNAENFLFWLVIRTRH